MAIPKKTTPTNPELLSQEIRDTFPDLKFDKYIYIGQGWDHEVLILDDKYVFRFPNRKNYSEGLKLEIPVLKLLEPLVSVSIPKYQYIKDDFSFAGYPIINGEPLTIERFRNLSETDQTDFAKQLARFLSVIHTVSITSQPMNKVPRSNLKEDQEYIKLKVKEFLIKALDDYDYKIVQEILEEVGSLLKKPLPIAFIHADMCSKHLLWEGESKQLGVIDFSDMSLGDPAFDFAELYEYGKDFIDEVYKYYKGPKDETFLYRAWIYQKWVVVFMMINHFDTHKISFEKAKEAFNIIKNKAYL